LRRRVLPLALLCAACVARSARTPTLDAPEEGLATWYGERHHGRTTASGEFFDMRAMTAAHKTLPFGTRVRVVDLATGASVVVRINDRGPYGPGRIIDLSRAAAERLGTLARGVARVRVEVIDAAAPDR
jgi:rare lipoprotein A